MKIASILVFALTITFLFPINNTTFASEGRADGGINTETGALFTKVTSGEIVTTEGLFWNGSWGDYDDDGWLDLFVGSEYSSERNYLFHNDRDGTFSLIDDAAMPKIPSNQHGSAWGDYDNDGHLDLIVTAGNPEIAHSMLYRNNGDGTFSWTNNDIYNDPFYYEHPESMPRRGATTTTMDSLTSSSVPTISTIACSITTAPAPSPESLTTFS